MTGFPKNDTEVSAFFQEGQTKGFLPKSGELFKCLESQIRHYQETGLPQRKMEGWRYFPFEKVLKAGYQFSPLSEILSLEPKPPVLSSSTVLPVKNGQFPIDFQRSGLKVWSWKEFLKETGKFGREVEGKNICGFKEKKKYLKLFEQFFFPGWVDTGCGGGFKNPFGDSISSGF